MVDALALGASGRKAVEVQVLFRAPILCACSSRLELGLVMGLDRIS